MKTVILAPPQLAASAIKEQITCIRAHRERIFNVCAQVHADKLIIHNYGQGGAGWTFLFGCVQEAIQQFEEATRSPTNTPIAVIGAGCYGLLTAILLARKGYTIRIIAKEIHNLPSSKAAGFFFPRARKCSNPQERAIFESYGMESYAQYLRIARGDHPFIQAGAQILPAYYGLDIDAGFAPYIHHKLMNSPKGVIIDFGNGKRYDAQEYHVIFMNTAVLMQELERTRAELGIPITQAEIAEFAEVPEPIIFNCTGMGAKMLAGDHRIIPVQGHLISLKNQNSEQLQYMINMKVIQKNAEGRARDELIYFAPKEQGILGITFIRGQHDPHANQHEFERLLARSRDFFGP